MRCSLSICIKWDFDDQTSWRARTCVSGQVCSAYQLRNSHLANAGPQYAVRRPSQNYNMSVHLAVLKIKGKGKLHPRTSHEWPKVEYKYSYTLSLTSALDGVCDQRYALAALPPGKRHITNCIRCWVGHRVGLDGCGKSRPNRDSILGPSSYTDYAIPAPNIRIMVALKIDQFHNFQQFYLISGKSNYLSLYLSLEHWSLDLLSRHLKVFFNCVGNVN
jgi:hypothetical protein